LNALAAGEKGGSMNTFYGEHKQTTEVKPTLAVTYGAGEKDYAKFTCSPLERGYGTTLGNALRRTLLSSAEGAAIVSFKIDGVKSGDATIPHVKEDKTEVILNLKEVRVKLKKGEETGVVKIQAHGPLTMKADQIKGDSKVTVVNKPKHILTLEEGGKISMTLWIKNGKSYALASRPPEGEHGKGAADDEMVYLDAMFSPVTRVDFTVSSATFGRRTDYDKLVMEVWTDGRISPQEAVSSAAALIKDELQVFYTIPGTADKKALPLGGLGSPYSERNPFSGDLSGTPIEKLELSVRSTNGLKTSGVMTLADLLSRSETELLKTKNLGRKSLIEIKEILSRHSLSLKR
jgi:DNA-directed RNA polymerase subunit alpha